MKARESGGQAHPQVHRQGEAMLSYMRSCQGEKIHTHTYEIMKYCEGEAHDAMRTGTGKPESPL